MLAVTQMSQYLVMEGQKKQAAFSGVPQLTLTWSLTDPSHLHSCLACEDTAKCQLQAPEMSYTQGTLETIRSVKVQPLEEDRCTLTHTAAAM